MAVVKDTTWEFTLTKQDDEGTVMDKVTKTIDGSHPSQDVVNELQVDGWVVKVMTLLDTNYE